MAAFRRILVATDFTESADHALDWAVELAARLGASITLMHAYAVPILSFPDGTVVATADVASRIADAARGGLDAAAERHQGRGVPIDTVLREGAAPEEINRLAHELDADLVVVGTHGRKGLVRAILGSVAESVVRTASRPVATVRAPHP